MKGISGECWAQILYIAFSVIYTVVSEIVGHIQAWFVRQGSEDNDKKHEIMLKGEYQMGVRPWENFNWMKKGDSMKENCQRRIKGSKTLAEK